MEKMTENEKQLLAKLRAKEKRCAREEAAFMVEADKRKAELLERWGIPMPEEVKRAKLLDERLENSDFECEPAPWDR